MLEAAGVIHSLELQPKYPISINGIHCFNYVADFRFMQDGKQIVQDAKGFITPVYRIKKKCVEAFYGIKIVET